MRRYLYLSTAVAGVVMTAGAGVSFAQCVTTQNCAELGYTETSCPDGTGIKCPFGDTFACTGGSCATDCAELGFTYPCTGANESGSGKSCGGKYTACTCTSPYTWSNGACSCPSTYKYTCSGTGYSGGSGTACGGKYTKCSCKSGYTWKNGTCQKQYPGCTIGALFYSDNTCSSSLSSSKTLLGVVIYEKTSTQNGWVMTVNPIDSNVMWNRLVDTSFTGVTETAANTSCTNTQNLIRLSSTFYDAAKIANDYKLGDKKWCLPSYDVLNNITNSTNFDKIDSGIDAAGGTLIGLGENTVEYIWSSSEYNGNQAWALTKWYRGEPKMEVRPKHKPATNYTVRPVFSF